jgi:DNA-binding SARP family transcriptional activator
VADAAEYFDESLRLAEEVAEREPTVEALRLKGEMAVFNRDLGTARELLRRAQTEGQLLESAYQLACIERALGRLYLAERSAERAIPHLEAAQARFDQSSGPDEAIVTLYWLGTAYLAHGATRQAEDALERAVALASKLAAISILAAPAAEDGTLLRHGIRLGRDVTTLSNIERLAVTRQAWMTPSVPPAPAPASDNGMPRVEVHLLGSFVVHVDGQLIDAGVRAAGRDLALLALLLLHPDGLSGREIIELLWPDMPPAKAQANVQMTAYRLRRLLGSRSAVANNRARYQLAPELVTWVDVRQLEEAVKRAGLAPPDEARRHLQEAVDIYRGHLLADTAWTWAEPFRHHYQELAMGALLRLADLVAPDDADTWRRLIHRILSLEPDNEEAFERLLGQARARGDALTQAHVQRRYEAVMAGLGLQPNPRLLASA